MMFNKVLAAALAASVAVLAISSVAAEEENVVTLTADNFKETVDGNEFVLVEFYAPWCGHCKALAPEYEKAATKLKEDGANVVIAKVDATAEESLAKEFEIQGFPTLKWFVNGAAKEYGGGRTEATIISWINKKIGDPATKIADVAQLDKLKEDNEVLVVGVFASEEEGAAFVKAAQDEEEVPYAIAVGNDDVAKAAGVTAPGVVVFKKFDEGRVEFSGDVSSKDAVSEFVAGNSLPLIVPFSQENAPKIFGGKIKSHLLIFVDAEKADAKTAVLDTVRPVAEENKGKILFVTVDKSDDRILEFFGITEADIPTARIVNMGEGAMKKYAYEGAEITTEGVKEFVANYFDDKLAPQLKSEEVPEKNDEPVMVLVGKNFDEIVDDEDKDVLVEFYAPWCGHCKKLAPIYDELGEKYKDNDKVIIAKMDATANEVERVSIQGFPTIKFFPAGSKEVIDYDGARDLDGFVDFLKKNAKNVE